MRTASEGVRCIAHVPERKDRTGTVPGHRCRYEAHAFAVTGTKVCKVHGNMRVRRPRRQDAAQCELPLDGGNT